jgi:gamma-glutamyltranspeptidase/glutathione hydrolase
MVSGKAVASEAGLEMLNAGGNAADAGAATLLALSDLTVRVFLHRQALAGQGGAPTDREAIEW